MNESAARPAAAGRRGHAQAPEGGAQLDADSLEQAPGEGA